MIIAFNPISQFTDGGDLDVGNVVATVRTADMHDELSELVCRYPSSARRSTDKILNFNTT